MYSCDFIYCIDDKDLLHLSLIHISKAIVDANAAYKTQAEFLANMSHAQNLQLILSEKLSL